MAQGGWRAVLGLFLLAGCGDSSEGGGFAVTAGIQAQSDPLFNENEVNDFHLTMSDADWASILADSMGDTYRHARLTWRNLAADDVGVRPRGHSTRHPGNPKMSLKIKINEFVPGQRFAGLKEIKLDGLRESTQMRERIAYGVFRQLIPTAPRAAHCRLFVNGEYRGLYMIEESPNGDLVKHRHGGEAGNLYHVFVGDPEAYTYLGSDPTLYTNEQGRPWGPETNELDGDHTVVPKFLDVLNHRPAETGNVCTLENLTTYLALEVALVSRDGMLRDDGPPQNHFAYLHPMTGRFEFLPWDLDQCLTQDRAWFSIWHNFHHSYLTRLVRDTPALNQSFRTKIAQVVAALTHPDKINPRIDAVYQQIREHVYADNYKLISNSDFDYYPTYLKDVFRARYESLRAELGLP